MYPLGDQFKLNIKPESNPKYVFKGNKYRITILSERLIRLEYSESGHFENMPTEFAWNRNFSEPHIDIKQDSRYLEIKTAYFKLSYKKEKSFKGTSLVPTGNLKVTTLKNDKVWYYKHPEVRNYGAPSNSISKKKSKLKFTRGLYSVDGFASFDDSNSRIIDSDGTFKNRQQSEIDIYLFFYVNDYYKALEDYYNLTGYPSLIPRYALGVWWSRNIEYNDITLKKLIDTFEKKQIPLSVLLLDDKWYRKNDLNDSGFTFNREIFRVPYDMISYIHEKGIKLGLSVDPTNGFGNMDDVYPKAIKYLQPDSKGIIPFDLLNPRCIDVYLKIYIHSLDALGVDFYWLKPKDNTSNDIVTYLKHYHMYDMMRNYERRPLILARNSMKCSHRYPILYSGKMEVGWNTLEQIPYYNLSATNIGSSFWAHDIGGYYKGIEDSELYLRFIQLGVFSPIFKFGSDSLKYYKREPWRWDVKTYTISKDYLTLRHQLIPYLYSEAYRYYKQGIPIIEPLYYKYPETYDDLRYKNEYYFGSEFFIIPIVNKKDDVMSRTVVKMFIPDGVWYDFVTGKKFLGNKEYTGFFKEQDYPVFAKAGSIIPLSLLNKWNDTTSSNKMEIHVFPGKSNSYKLYEDDGATDLYLKDYYIITSLDFVYTKDSYTLILKPVTGKSGIIPDLRSYKFRFRNSKVPSQIIVTENGKNIKFVAYKDANDFIIEVSNVKTLSQLSINCIRKNIEIEAVRIINEDIEDIISGLLIETEMKEKIDEILFGDLTLKKKRIRIRRLGNKGLDKKFVKLFLRLLEYIGIV